MAAFLKKWVAATGGMRSILALLYVLTVFGIPLSHTCQLADKGLHHCHLECSSCLLHSDEHVEVQCVAVCNQNDTTETAKSHDQCCLACLFSLTSKTFKLYSNTSLCSTQTVVRTQILPQLDFTKQFEWLSSISLRAPPGITS